MLILSAILGVLSALIAYRRPIHIPQYLVPPDPSYAYKHPRSCPPPYLRTRPFPDRNCLVLASLNHQSVTVQVHPPSNSTHTLLCAQHNISISGPTTITLSNLSPNAHYTLYLRVSYNVCTKTFVTRPSSTNFVINPSFEATSNPPFLASTFHPDYKHSPASWTPFYNGGARRVCGIIPLSPDSFAHPKAGNCALALGPSPQHSFFDDTPKFFGAHHALRLDLPATVVTAWYRTSPTIEYVPNPQSKSDSISLIISSLLDDGTQSDGVLIPLSPSSHWKPVCVHITAPHGRRIHMLNLYFHLHDIQRGTLLIDDVAVVAPHNFTPKKNFCYTISAPRSRPPAAFNTLCTHLFSDVRPLQKQLTLAVPLTADRVLRLEALSRLYGGGPIVAAVIVRNEEEATAFRSIWRRKKWLRSHVDVMFVRRGDGPIPINTIRNMAVRLAKTDFVVMLDVDMTPATKAFDCFRDPAGKFLEKLLPPREKRIATLPVFITDVHHRSARDKDELVNMLRQRKGTAYCLNSQKANKIKRWYMSSEASETKFLTDYEPYGIVRRDLHPMYDERFSGYGFNKIAWAVEAEAAGWKMFVLPDHFVTHLNHVENEWVSSIDLPHYLQTWRRYFAFVAEAESGKPTFLVAKPEIDKNCSAFTDES